MFSRVIVIAAGVAAATAQVQAADVYSPPPGAYAGYKDAYTPGPGWNGFYLGLNGGFGWNVNDASLEAYAHDQTGGAPGNSNSMIGSFERSGGFAGGQIGFNLTHSGFLFGIEADIQDADMSASTRGTAAAISGVSTTVTSAFASSRLDYFGTLRGRLGYTVDRALIYLTSGFAYGGVTDRLATGVTDAPAASYSNSIKSTDTLSGYVLGGGVEYALTPAWSLKAEYQYLDLGKVALADGKDPTASSAGVGVFAADHSYNTIRLGLNYRIQQEYAPLK